MADFSADAELNARKADADQLDLFIAHLVDVPLRDARDTMVAPFFSLAKGRRASLEWKSGETWVRISAPTATGIATVFDLDVLIWVASQINLAHGEGRAYSPRVQFQAYDLLRGIRRGTSGREYERLRAALKRLTATTVETSIKSDGERSAMFHWLERVEETIDAEGRSTGIVVELPRWLYERIVSREILSIPVEYFDITGGVARWLYRLVRKHAGRQPSGWSVTFRTLHDRSGSTQRFSDFALALRDVITDNTLPDYHLEAFKGAKGDDCLHAVRRELLPGDHPASRLELPRRRTTPAL